MANLALDSHELVRAFDCDEAILAFRDSELDRILSGGPCGGPIRSLRKICPLRGAMAFCSIIGCSVCWNQLDGARWFRWNARTAPLKDLRGFRDRCARTGLEIVLGVTLDVAGRRSGASCLAVRTGCSAGLAVVEGLSSPRFSASESLCASAFRARAMRGSARFPAKFTTDPANTAECGHPTGGAAGARFPLRPIRPSADSLRCNNRRNETEELRRMVTTCARFACRALTWWT